MTMASVVICNCQPLVFTTSFRLSLEPPPQLSYSPAAPLGGRRRVRGLTAVARAGPSANSYIFAFALPFSLLAITIAASWRIADNLDKDFLEDLAMNEAIMAAEEDDDDDEDAEEGDNETSKQEEPALARARNRPKREA